MTTISEPNALADLLAGFRLLTRLYDEGVLDADTLAFRLEVMRAKAARLGIGREFREGCEGVAQCEAGA